MDNPSPNDDTDWWPIDFETILLDSDKRRRFAANWDDVPGLTDPRCKIGIPPFVPVVIKWAHDDKRYDYTSSLPDHAHLVLLIPKAKCPREPHAKECAHAAWKLLIDRGNVTL